MRAVRRILLLASISILYAASSGAAVLPFTGSLSLVVAFLTPATVSGSGVATVNGPGTHLATLGMPASPFATSGLVVPITDPAAAPIQGIQLTAHNGAGAIVGGGGVIPLLGVAKVCLFGACPAFPVANLSIPLNVVGAGGANFVVGIVNLTAIGAPWTVGTAAVGSITQMGFAHGPASLTSSTAAPSGVLQLVTPIFVSTNIGSSAVVPAFGVISLHFVPEPGTMLLLAGGLSLLAMAGRHRMQAAQASRQPE